MVGRDTSLKFICSSCDGLDGQHTVIKARGVNYTVYMEARRVPVEAATVFLKMTKRALKAHQMEDQVDMVIGKDNGKWLPQHVCDSCQPEDNLTLMKSEFHPRYIVRETRRLKGTQD